MTLTTALAIDSLLSFGEALFPVQTQIPASPLSTIKQSWNRIRALYYSAFRMLSCFITIFYSCKVLTFVSNRPFFSGLEAISVIFNAPPSSLTLIIENCTSAVPDSIKPNSCYHNYKDQKDYFIWQIVCAILKFWSVNDCTTYFHNLRLDAAFRSYASSAPPADAGFNTFLCFKGKYSSNTWPTSE